MKSLQLSVVFALACNGCRAWTLTSTPLQTPTLRKKSTSSLRMQSVLIEDWKLLTNGRVSGRVMNHPEIPDGRIITTSPLSNVGQAAPNKLVTTSTGSKYQLGEPQMTASPKTGQKIPLPALQRQAKLDFDLTGEIVGDDDRQYLLSGEVQKSTSGKSRISKAYEANQDGLPTGDSVTVKISSNMEAMDREANNFAKITRSGLSRGKFVKLVDVLMPASIITKKFGSMAALVLERGVVDLKRYIGENGALEGKELREAAVSAAQCLQAIHNSGLVWTDLKTENFVVTRDGQVKGIDLESCMAFRDNPVDYSPEATPPEFAKAFMEGDGPYFKLEYSYDIWSFGMLLYEISTGKGYFDGNSPSNTIKILRGAPEIDVSAVEDDQLRDLISKCLKSKPKDRINIVGILLHPYFFKKGIGPISF